VNKKLAFFAALLVLLIIPLVCFIVVYVKSGNGHVKLPPYYGGYTSIGQKVVRGNTVPDTQWHVVPNIALVNQLGQKVNICKDLDGKIVVMDFFFSTCNTTCPQLNKNLKFLQTKYRKVDSMLHFISITVDPVTDSFPQLRRYANSLGANHDKWWFCTGDAGSIKNYMVSGVKLPDVNKDSTELRPGEHSNKWVLLDRERNIRGYYDALDTNEIRRCADDISLIILEKKHLAQQ
jgi:protein SCO1